MEAKTKIIIILAILLIGAVGYMVYDQYNTYKQNKEISLVQFGFAQAVNQIVQQSQNCQEVQINIDSKLIKLKNIDC